MNGACWLMNRFGVGDDVCGDIVEQAAAGRSRFWLWRQAVGAIGTALLRDVTSTPLDVAGTLLIGLLLVSLATWGFRATGQPLENWMGEHLRVSLSTFLLFVGLTVALIHVPAWLAIGWLFARVHRTRIVLLLLIVVGAQSSPHYIRQTYGALTVPTFHHEGVLVSLLAIEMFSFTAGTLAGALCVRPGAA